MAGSGLPGTTSGRPEKNSVLRAAGPVRGALKWAPWDQPRGLTQWPKTTLHLSLDPYGPFYPQLFITCFLGSWVPQNNLLQLLPLFLQFRTSTARPGWASAPFAMEPCLASGEESIRQPERRVVNAGSSSQQTRDWWVP